jgi:hypothetical protein
MKRNILRFLFAGLPLVAAVMLVADDSPRIKLQDDCQPKTFNLDPPNGAGPGVCSLDFDGRTPFAKFIQEILATHQAADWRFDDIPDHVSA